MENSNILQKDENRELPVPLIWRDTLKAIANSFVERNFPSSNIKEKLSAFDHKIIIINYGNIDDYPDKLGLLGDATWQTSIYIWDGDYWRVLLDLSDVDGNTTDLVLHLKVRENGNDFLFEPYLIYVP